MTGGRTFNGRVEPNDSLQASVHHSRRGVVPWITSEAYAQQAWELRQSSGQLSRETCGSVTSRRTTQDGQETNSVGTLRTATPECLCCPYMYGTEQEFEQRKRLHFTALVSKKARNIPFAADVTLALKALAELHMLVVAQDAWSFRQTVLSRLNVFSYKHLLGRFKNIALNNVSTFSLVYQIPGHKIWAHVPCHGDEASRKTGRKRVKRARNR